MFEFERLLIEGAFAIHSDIHRDERGSFQKIIHNDEFHRQGLRSDFKEHYFSRSKKNVVRGMHFQIPPHEHAKIVYCPQGSAIDVLLDIRKDSLSYGKYVEFELSENRPSAIYVPIGVAHGFLATENDTIMVYSVTSVYNSASDSGILWNSFGYKWPVGNPIISDRDLSFSPLNKFSTPFEAPVHA
jgi:dTDP-4-dehydrorhamnose 3,5-epimerase